MEERRGVIRNVQVEGAWGNKGYDIVLTNERTIFVFRQADRRAAGAAVGSLVPLVGAPSEGRSARRCRRAEPSTS